MKARLAWLPAWIVTLAFAAAGLAVVLGRTVDAAFARVSLTYNEGWNAYHTVAALTGGALYPPADAFVFNNYPPLSFLIVGMFDRAVGDPVAAGRILASAGLVAAAVATGVAAWRLGAGVLGGAVAAATALLLAAGLYPGYVGMNDPQWLGHAIMAAGLAAFVAPRPRLAGDVLACALMLAAGLIKHNLLPVPLAVTAFLLCHDRARLLRWIAIGAVLAGLALVWMYAAYGAAVFTSVLGHARITVPHRAVEFGRLIFLPLLPLAWVACVALWMARTQPAARLAVFYLVIAAGTGLASLAGEGVWWNAAFDTVLALALAAGLAVGWLVRIAPSARGLAATLAVLALFLPFARLAEGGVWGMVQFRRDLPAREAAFQAGVTALAAEPGPVACEVPALCFWAGQPFRIDPFNADQAARRSPAVRKALHRALAEGAFGALQITPGGEGVMEQLLRRTAPEMLRDAPRRSLSGAMVLLEPPPR